MLHAWFDSIPRRGHLHPLGWDHASGPETGARVLFRLRALELGFADVVVRDSADHGARPVLVEGIVPEHSAADTPFVEKLEKPLFLKKKKNFVDFWNQKWRKCQNKPETFFLKKIIVAHMFFFCPVNVFSFLFYCQS